ncbi:MAG: 3-deoxy-D-manno-octulosonic acid transferase, partial [Acidobacteria bacterium]|nr:3-deoxy-D-manno-octulosonic acid transferase [Acidobacteriota bacterium]
GPVIVCGSTVEGEEPALLRGFQRLVQHEFNQALLVLAPRKPERFAEVARLIHDSGLPCVRRSESSGTITPGGVLLLDSIGELAGVYAIAGVAIVGGSFARAGGHNILEPAWFSRPIVIGPHYENFRDVVEQFRVSAALAITEDPISTAADLLRDPELAAELGRRARAVMEVNSGATDATLSHLRSLLPMRSTERVQEMAR